MNLLELNDSLIEIRQQEESLQWPVFNEEYLKEDSVKYTISFNGKARFTMEFPADADNDTIQATVMADEQAQKWIEGKTPKKVIIVPKKIVNIVL